MNGIMKVRLSFLSLGFGVALLFAPSAHAQAETNPDHFTETGVELDGNVTRTAVHTAALREAKKPEVASAAQQHSAAAPVHVALAVADRNRPAINPAPKR